ncbi:MAG: 16S rRNA (adenine(1518)-N(6)/adenine(1519)-N(6))-dimethyltransferase RsmA [Planctomycetota bacterium]
MSTGQNDHLFQTQTQIRGLLAAAGGSPRKRYGQHFLVDRNLMAKLLEAAQVEPEDCILEIGVGTGSLTGLLSARAGRVVAVEIDKRLFEVATEQLASSPNVTLLRLDALSRKSAVNPAVRRAIDRARSEVDGALKLVANLPYDIATPLVLNLLLDGSAFERMCFTVQAEVADRFLAAVGTAAYGPVSIIAQVLTEPRRVCPVPRQAFWPVPRVDSAMVCLLRRPGAEIEGEEVHGFSALVKSFFLHRRKSIRHTAATREDRERCLAALAESGIDGRARPETVGVEQWVSLYRALR